MRARSATAGSPCARMSSAIASRSLTSTSGSSTTCLEEGSRRPPGHRCASGARLSRRSRPYRSPTRCVSSSSSAPAAPGGPIRLLTQLRTFGHCFNPVSFYYCFDDAETLSCRRGGGDQHAVGRTPRVCARAFRTRDGCWRREIAKRVARLAVHGDGSDATAGAIGQPGGTLSVHIESSRGRQLAFDATLPAAPAARRARRPARMTARYPAATLRVLALIYGQALALRLKGVAVHLIRRAQRELDRAIARRIALGVLRSQMRAGGFTIVEGASPLVIRVTAAPRRPYRCAPPRLADAVARQPRDCGGVHAGAVGLPDLMAWCVLRHSTRARLDRGAGGLLPCGTPGDRAGTVPATRAPAAVVPFLPLRPRKRALRADARPDDQLLVRPTSRGRV